MYVLNTMNITVCRGCFLWQNSNNVVGKSKSCWNIDRLFLGQHCSRL